MDLICINNTFPPDYLTFYKANGVKIPEINKVYTLRHVRDIWFHYKWNYDGIIVNKNLVNEIYQQKSSWNRRKSEFQESQVINNFNQDISVFSFPIHGVEILYIN